MLPKHLRYEPESEVYNTGLVGVEIPQVVTEDSNGNNNSVQEKVQTSLIFLLFSINLKEIAANIKNSSYLTDLQSYDVV